MKERATMIGGKLDIQSEPGKGTTIMITVPSKIKTGLPQVNA
jgi:signal transduction histidine kinase